MKPVEDVEDPSAPVVVVEVEKPKNIKTLELVQCDKCNKQMTKNTLRYHHEKSCPGKPIDTQALPVKRRTKPTEANTEETIPYNNKGLLSQGETIPKGLLSQAKLGETSEVNKQPTYRDKLNERNLKRKESIGKLALQIA